jgi:hypothetical protein
VTELVGQAAYLKIHVGPRVFRTVEVRPDPLVDVSADGRIVGVERLGGPVDLGGVFGSVGGHTARGAGVMRRRIELLRAYVVWFGYQVRPYDMLADRRRWFWQPRTRCLGLWGKP